MERKHVSSSNLHSVGYDLKTETLEIKFHESGIYHYFNVPEIIYNKLMAAHSKGSYFDEHIKPKFRYRKISN